MVSPGLAQSKSGHDRRRWVSQTRAEQPSCTRRLTARATEAMAPVTRTPVALKMDGRDFTNSVNGDEVWVRSR